MAGIAQGLISAALSLLEDERIRVASGILDSLEALDPHQNLSDLEFETMLVRRADALRSGQVTGVPWSQVKAQVDKKLGGEAGGLSSRVVTHTNRRPGYWISRG